VSSEFSSIAGKRQALSREFAPAFRNAYSNFQSDLKKRPTAQEEIHHPEPEAGKEGLPTRLRCGKAGHSK
jgi:hypothetical protein